MLHFRIFFEFFSRVGRRNFFSASIFFFWANFRFFILNVNLFQSVLYWIWIRMQKFSSFIKASVRFTSTFHVLKISYSTTFVVKLCQFFGFFFFCLHFNFRCDQILYQIKQRLASSLFHQRAKCSFWLFTRLYFTVFYSTVRFHKNKNKNTLAVWVWFIFSLLQTHQNFKRKLFLVIRKAASRTSKEKILAFFSFW